MLPDDSFFREKQSVSRSSIEESLSGLIAQRTGIAMREFQMPMLRRALEVACKQFGYHDTVALSLALIQGKDTSAEFEFLLTHITVGESHFFRYSGQIALLRDQLLPALIAHKRCNHDYSIRMWSAGCSNGQEIYSMVIMLHEMLPDINRWKLHFLATDINKNVLSDAIHGRYSEWSLRDTPQAIVTKYFVKNHGEYRLHEDICKQVKFAYLNLAQDVFPALHNDTNAMDIILCRNVFIYLEMPSIRNIMQRFSDCLVPEGLLFLGPSDFWENHPDKLEFIQLDGAAYLRRKCDSQSVRSVFPETNVSIELSTPGNDFIESSESVTATGTAITDPADCLRTGRWDEALIAVEQALQEEGESQVLLQIKSKALANLGHLDDALQCCRRSIALDPVDKHAYLLQGTILLESAQLQEAEQSLRKAIFLDHTFCEAHYQLGLLLIQQGRRKMGLKCLSHALLHANKALPHLEVHNAPGMTYQRFAEIVQNEMNIYAGSSVNKK